MKKRGWEKKQRGEDTRGQFTDQSTPETRRLQTPRRGSSEEKNLPGGLLHSKSLREMNIGEKKKNVFKSLEKAIIGFPMDLNCSLYEGQRNSLF